MHGWQDNAASFLRLAPQLSGHHVVAPDLSGQGRSDFRSLDATYQIWDDLPQLAGLRDALGWDRCALLGHSRGAIMSTLMSAAQPERVDSVVLLDAIVPPAVADSAFPVQLGAFLRDRNTAGAASPRRYASRAEAVAARARRGLPEAAAKALAGRGLAGDDERGWEWRIDPRLRGASAVKMSDGQIRALLGAISAPVLLLQAVRGMMQSHPLDDMVRSHVRDLRVEAVPGDHHFHMEAVIDEWVPTILSFMEQS
nr:alpha/beta hydrolase [Parahaliea mediterranea]